MIRRVVLLVLNGLGLGALPDAADRPHGDLGSLGQAFAARPEVTLPNLEILGLGRIASHPHLRRMDQPEGCFGRMMRQSPGRDVMTAWWECAGVPAAEELPSWQQGVSDEVCRLIQEVSGREVLASRSDVPEELLASAAPQSVREKKLVVWGGAGGACYLGAHDSLLSAKELFRLAREVRTASTGRDLNIYRVGARPFAGGAGTWHWAPGWRDHCAPIGATSLFDHLLGAEQLVTSFGKCGDFFNGKGFTRSIPIDSTAAAWSDLVKTLSTTPRGLIVVGLFDDLVRVPGEAFAGTLAEQLSELDARLPALQRLLKPGDCVCLMGDQARDAQHPHLGRREYLPLLIFGPGLARGVNLGDRATLADLGQTLVDAFYGARLSVGESFLPALRPG